MANNKNYQSNIPQVKDALSRAEIRTLEAIGIFIDSETQARCPVGEYPGGMVGGQLRASYTHKVNEAEKSVTNGSPLEYAVYVEKGTGKHAEGGRGRQTPWRFPLPDGSFRWTSGMKAQPHLTPAAEDNLNRIGRLAQEMMKID